MSGLPLGWATDIAVLQLMGSTVDDRGDHLVVRTPANPLFHWGNCIFVTDPGGVDDADRWVGTFEAAVPTADWVAVGLVQMPAETAGWARHGLELELDDVLATSTMPRQTLPPDGYTVHALVTEADWAQFIARDIALNEESDHHERQSHERFARARALAYREMSHQGHAMFVGAFFEGRLVGELGIVRCGETARYQTVGTDPAHRGRGICSHLLGVAAAWAVEWGARQWVIVTAATNPAGRVYRRAGFELAEPIVTAYRPPSARAEHPQT
jgi:GNAT superfamily N-acetyltransferase